MVCWGWWSVAGEYLADFGEGVAGAVEEGDEFDEADGLVVEESLVAVGAGGGADDVEHEVVTELLGCDAGELGGVGEAEEVGGGVGLEGGGHAGRSG